VTDEQLILVLAAAAVGALVVIALTAILLAIAVRRLLRDLAGLSAAAEETTSLINEQLPATLADLRGASANLARLSGELDPRLERVDGLLDESEQTLLSLRATVEAAEEMVRGPAAAVDRARRTVRAAGEGLARGADKLRRGVEEAAGRRERD
jgi:ABC-type transporter Mla subunit MlaD